MDKNKIIADKVNELLTKVRKIKVLSKKYNIKIERFYTKFGHDEEVDNMYIKLKNVQNCLEEEDKFLQAYKQCNYDISSTANLLHISNRTVYRRLNKYVNK